MFSELAKQLTSNFTSFEKATQGIYFTPQSHINTIVKKLLRHISKNNVNVKTILEPSCGACEFITALDKNFANTYMYGVEKNKKIYNSIKNHITTNKNTLILKNNDFIKTKNVITASSSPDLIIGNPPYFVVNKSMVTSKYNEHFDGRPNIFILFILKSLEMLNENGILAFILPNNFLNCIYYNKTRLYINNNFKILDILSLDNSSYLDTTQPTCCVIIQKINKRLKENRIFCIAFDNNIITFNTKSNCKILKQLRINSTTLNKLQFKAYVGNILWNKYKHLLSNDATKPRLIYSSDCKIKRLSKPTCNMGRYIEKKPYINKLTYNTNPIIVINRGYGTGKYEFKYCIVNERRYFIENHLICLEYYGSNGDDRKIQKAHIIQMYNKILDSFNDDRTKEFIRLYFGTNSMNTQELLHVLPIYTVSATHTLG